MARVEGWCEDGFAPLREAFAANFDMRGEMGASLAVMRHGRMVVDLWGGEADAGRAWERHTTACMMSVAKGFVALAAARLVERGALDLDAPVARHWPEFARNGKQDVTPRHVLTHVAGIPVADAAPAGTMRAQRACAAASSAKP